MKSLCLLIFMSLSFTTFAQELKHEAFCNSESVKSIKGINGFCSLIFTLNKAAAQNTVRCTGTFMNVIPCAISYTIGSSFSSAQYSCGADPLKPIVKQSFSPEITSYSVAALITKENHDQDIVNDPTSYTNLSGKSMKIDIETSKVEGVQKQSIVISLKMADWTDLTGVVCN